LFQHILKENDVEMLVDFRWEAPDVFQIMMCTLNS
jgi:hypothetical protein